MVEVKIDFSRVTETRRSRVFHYSRANYTRARETGCPNKIPENSRRLLDGQMAREREQKRLPANIFAVAKRGQPEYRRRSDDGDALQRLFVSLTRNVEISLSVSVGPPDIVTSHPTARIFINC